MPPGFEEVVEHGMQVRCRDCKTGWIIVNFQEDVSSASHRLCEACLRQNNSQHAEKRAQNPKPTDRSPKQASKKSN